MLRRIIGVAVVSGLLFAGMAGPGLISGVPVAVADQGNAAVIEKVGSSLVYVRTRFMGRVKVTDAVGASWSELLVVNGQCSGYVVDPRGYIVTAGHCVDGDDDGPLPEALDAARGARFLYLLPNFQNPSGRCMGAARRLALAERALEIGLPIVEDNPYGDLWFDNPPSPQARAALQDQP